MTPFFRDLREGCCASVGYDFWLHGGASIGIGCTLLAILDKGDFEDNSWIDPFIKIQCPLSLVTLLT